MFEEQFKAERKGRRRKLTSEAVFTSLREEGSATLGDLLDRFGLESVGKHRVYRRIYELLAAHMITVRVLENNVGLYVANRGVGLIDLEEYREARRLEYRVNRDLTPKDGYKRPSIVKRSKPVVIETLKKAAKPLGTAPLAKRCKMQRETCARHLRRLFVEGLVERFVGLKGEYFWSLKRQTGAAQ